MENKEIKIHRQILDIALSVLVPETTNLIHQPNLRQLYHKTHRTNYSYQTL